MRLELSSVRLDDAIAASLVTRLQADLTVRYGEPDPVDTPVEDFLPPRGVFVVARLDGQPVGCAGLRDLHTRTAELKRMYVDPAARGRGVARALLADLEQRAVAVGVHSLRLIAGDAQPEALALYARSGWHRIPAFGSAVKYGWTDAVSFGRDLSASAAERAGRGVA